MTVTPAFNFTTGVEAAIAEEEANRSTSGAGKGPIRWLRLADKESITLRYLFEPTQIPFVKQHNAVPTGPKPADWTGNWSQIMTSVCRYDKAFQGAYKDCYVCDNKIINTYNNVIYATPRGWTVAVGRVPAKVTQEMVDDPSNPATAEMLGMELGGFMDETVMVEERDANGKGTGVRFRSPVFYIINQGTKNFFSHLQGAYAHYKSVTDRDFTITRHGSDKNTEYQHFAGERTDDIKPGNAHWQYYTESMTKLGLNIHEMIANKASDDFYRRFFGPNAVAGGAPAPAPATSPAPAPAPAPVAAPVPQAAPAPAAAAPTAAANDDVMAAIRARLAGGAA